MMPFLQLILIALLWNQVSSTDDKCDHKCFQEGSCKRAVLGDDCYYYFTDMYRTWNETRKLCESQGLTMVKLSKDFLSNKSMVQMLTEKFRSKPAWLGGISRDLGDWTYVNGVPYDQAALQLHRKFYNSVNKHHCGTMAINSGLNIDLDNCFKNHHILCRFDKKTGEENIHIIVNKKNNWYKARTVCMDKGGDLFYLEKDENFSSMTVKMADFKDMTFFIGLRHEVWEWEDGEEIFHFNWNENEPSAFDEKCMSTYQNGKWNDIKCSAKQFPVCQKVSPSKTTTPSKMPPKTTLHCSTGIVQALGTSLTIAIIAITGLVVYSQRKTLQGMVSIIRNTFPDPLLMEQRPPVEQEKRRSDFTMPRPPPVPRRAGAIRSHQESDVEKTNVEANGGYIVPF